jgi:hypothetical protein
VWFNGWPQLAATAEDSLGADQGEMVGAMLSRDRQPWNQAFASQPVQVPPDGDLPVVALPGGAQVTVLGPGPRQLAKLRREWTKVLREIGVTPGRVDAALERLTRRKDLVGPGDALGGRAGLDNSVANSTSISLLFEHQERKLLLTGDSHGDVLAMGLRKLLAARGGQRLTVDAFKLPHHGSRGNVTNEVLGLVDTTRYLVSTSGARYHHPDREAMQRILGRSGRSRLLQLYFNYDSETTRPWGEPERQRRYRYEAVFPTAPDVGVTVEV